MTIPKRLDWMTKEDWENIYFHWGCVCDYDMRWDDEKDYEEWCKRVLNNTPRYRKDWVD